jgi:hypothetical protein
MAIHIPMPVPKDEAVHAVKTSWMWQQPDTAVREHVAHAIVTAVPGDDAVAAAWNVARLSAAMLKAGAGAALYWGNGRQVHAPRVVEQFSQSEETPPVPLWVGITISGGRGRCSSTGRRSGRAPKRSGASGTSRASSCQDATRSCSKCRRDRTKLGCAAPMGFHIANGFGDSLKAPTVEQMRAFLDDLDITDEEHGAAWLSTDEGLSLEWNGDGPRLLRRSWRGAREHAVSPGRLHPRRRRAQRLVSTAPLRVHQEPAESFP